MPQHIFYSWQSDTSTRTGRNLIERALEQAIAALAADAEIDPADRDKPDLAIDRDSVDVPGQPPLVDTIFGKIDTAAMFLADLTYVAKRADGRLMPNPNVLLEYGWALKARSWRRIISVMNVAHGDPDDHPMPFDLQHYKRPIQYDCPDDADQATRAAARTRLKGVFVKALRAILSDEAINADSAPALSPHPHDIDLLDQVHRQLPLTLQRFFRQHNFGTPHRRDILGPLYVMNEDWVGARFEFDDPVLQEAFLSLRQRASALGDLTLAHLYPLDGTGVVMTPKTDRDRAIGAQETTLAAIGAMNVASTALADAIDAFERVARDRLRVASGAVGGAVPAAALVDARAEKVAAASALLADIAQDQNLGRASGIVSRPRMALRVVPLAALEGSRLDAKAVVWAQRRFPPDTLVKAETGSDGRHWWSIEPPRDVGQPNREARWRTRLVRPGAFEYEATIGFRIDGDPEIVVDGRELEREIVCSLERLGSIAGELGLGGPTLVGIAFDGTEDVMLSRPRAVARRIGQPFFALPPLVIEDLTAPFADRLHETFDILWLTAGWPGGSTSFSSGSWDGYRG